MIKLCIRIKERLGFTMRKILLLVIILLVCSCVACASKNVGTTGDTSTSSPTTTKNATSTDNIQTTVAVTTAAVTTEGIDVEFYTALAKSNIEKSILMGKATIDFYTNDRILTSPNFILAETLKIGGSNYSSAGTSSVWHYTSFYAMTSRLAKLSEGEDKNYFSNINNNTYKGFGYYRGTTNVITYNDVVEMNFYGVNRGSKIDGANVAGDQAVYDDQMWIIRECIYSYKSTGNVEYLNEAMRLSKLCIAGWDSTIGVNGKEYGGIPWGPSYATKHTCSNAPIISPLVEIYEILKAQDNSEADYYLEWAKKIYSFTYKTLRNGNYTFGDLVGTSRERRGTKYVTTGQSSGIDNTAYTYNTGAMISGAAALYRATGEENYYRQGKNFANGAYNVFLKKYNDVDCAVWFTKCAGTELSLSSTLWFNLVLLQGFIDLAPYYDKCETYIMYFQDSLDYAYENHLKDGLFPRNYVEGWNLKSNEDANKNVMDQAASAQMYSMIAEWAMSLVDKATGEN